MVEIKLRSTGDKTLWADCKVNIRIEQVVIPERCQTDSAVRRIVEAVYPDLAVCSVRWNVEGSSQGHYFEYERSW